MSGFSSFLKTIFIPLVVAAILYAIISYVILPLHRRYVQKYQHYLPLSAPVSTLSSTLSERSSPSWIRARLGGLWDALAGRLPFPLPFSAHSRHSRMSSASAAALYDDEDFDIEDGEGEGMVGFDSMDHERRREALDRQRGFGGADDVSRSERRLSRELEEGFRDSSDSEEEETGLAGQRIRR